MTLWRLMLACLLLALPAAANAQKFPPLSGRVVDAANMLSPEQEAQLTQLSDEIEKASSRQFVVATVPDLQGYPIEDYGVGLIRAWQLGQKGANNGIILIVAPNDRKVRIEVGYGLEPVMTDAYAGMIISNIIVPRFRSGDMAGGVLAGAAAIGEQMKLPLEAAEKRAQDQLKAAHAKGSRNRGGGMSGFIVLFVVFVVFAIVLSGLFGRRRHGRRYRGGSGVGNIVLWSVLDAAMRSGSSGGGSSWGSGGGGDSWGGGGGGGFSGGGGSGGGGGASGSW